MVDKVNGRQGKARRFAEQAAQKAIGQLQDVLREPLGVEIGPWVDAGEQGSRANARRALTGSGRGVREAGASQCDLPRGEAAVLTVIAQHTDGVSREQLSVLTNYKRSSSDTYLKKLAAAGRIEMRAGSIHATELGIEALGAGCEPLPDRRGVARASGSSLERAGPKA